MVNILNLRLLVVFNDVSKYSLGPRFTERRSRCHRCVLCSKAHNETVNRVLNPATVSWNSRAECFSSLFLLLTVGI